MQSILTARVQSIQLLTLGWFLLMTATSANDNTECTTKNNEECTWTDQDQETKLGFNALSARIAVISGQVPTPKLCGPWCKDQITHGASTPCKVDPTLVPCEGDFYCTTTCGLWHNNILKDPLNGYVEQIPTDSNFDAVDKLHRPKFTCDMFKRADGYVSLETAQICHPSCLLPEIQPRRYPAPTGLGFMCRRRENATCSPIASSLDYRPAAVLECPCNWFGSDCVDDWIQIEKLEQTQTLHSDNSNGNNDNGKDGIMVIAITIPTKDDWSKIMANHQPGGVIRITTIHSPTGIMREQPFAIATASQEQRTIEILSAPPDPALDVAARDVAQIVRAETQPVNKSSNGGGGETKLKTKLYINPSIAGFFNSNWQFLMDYLAQNKQIQHLILVSTGAGLSGSISTLQYLQSQSAPASLKSVHLYHGVRHVEELPYQSLLQETFDPQGGTTSTSRVRMQMTIVQSQPKTNNTPSESDTLHDLPMVQSAVESGFLTQRRVKESSTIDDTPEKVYVQHAMVHELLTSRGANVVLESTVFAVCGRLALLEDTKQILQKALCEEKNEKKEECLGVVAEHYYTNI